MIRAHDIETSARRFLILASGFLLFATTGCGLTEDAQQGGPSADVETAQGAITGGWVTLPLINGWVPAGSAYHAPAIGQVNGVVVFRGAMKATNPTSNRAFVLPAAYRPEDFLGMADASNIMMKVVLSGGVGGTLSYDFNAENGKTVAVSQDGMSDTAGPAALAFTSLDGASFDIEVGTQLTAPDWRSLYTWRQINDTTASAFVKMVDGFVRFQGFPLKKDTNNTNNFMFTLPEEFRTGYPVYTYANIGGPGTPLAWSEISIFPDGTVWAGSNAAVWVNGFNLEGVSYSRTLGGTISLPMSNGWTSYSGRQARVSNVGGVIRFQGAVSGGTTTTIGTLPTSLRPTKTVVLPTITFNNQRGKITVTSGGVMTVDNPLGLSNATQFTSLDGVSFGI
jgi:hypothetical protein